jgi:hypothetical protein
MDDARAGGWETVCRMGADRLLRLGILAGNTGGRLASEQLSLLADWGELGLRQLGLRSEVTRDEDLCPRQLDLLAEGFGRAIGHTQEALVILLDAHAQALGILVSGAGEPPTGGEHSAPDVGGRAKVPPSPPAAGVRRRG